MGSRIHYLKMWHPGILENSRSRKVPLTPSCPSLLKQTIKTFPDLPWKQVLRPSHEMCPPCPQRKETFLSLKTAGHREKLKQVFLCPPRYLLPLIHNISSSNKASTQPFSNLITLYLNLSIKSDSFFCFFWFSPKVSCVM